MRPAISFIISVFLLSLPLAGQSLKIVSLSDQKAIPYVAVYNQQRDQSCISDSSGSINLEIFHPGDTLSFQHPAYIIVHKTFEEMKGRKILALSPKKILIEEFIVSASKSRESSLETPCMVNVLKTEAFFFAGQDNAAAILENTGNIVVQKSQGGGGSPILRGFEANRILLLVDGVRMNNAIYRSGHLQSAITIDHAILERAEVVFGPSSVIYGSDALGGVVHYYTKEPVLSRKGPALTSAEAYIRGASANKALSSHLDFAIGGKHFAGLSSISYKDLGNIRSGSNRSPGLGDWGLIKHYAERIDGRDSMMQNNSATIQPKSGYRQIDLLQKIRYSPSCYVDWILNMQFSTSSEIHRNDKLNDYKGDLLRYAESFYGPQNRSLISLKNLIKYNNPLFTNVTTIIAWQDIDEDRYSRRFKQNRRLMQKEDVRVLSLNSDFLKLWSATHRLHYGIEVNHNRVSSSASYRDILTGEQSPALTRYPNLGSQTWSAAAYASYKWQISPVLLFNGGLRYNRSLLKSSFDNALLKDLQIQIANGALTGSVGLVCHPDERWQLKTMLSSGFRNPNVDDYGKVRAKDKYVTVPNGQLKPEYSYNAELGISHVIDKRVKLDFTAYYTWLKDAIVRTAYTLNGMDSLLYDGEMYRITANSNAAKARIYGGSLSLYAEFYRYFELKGSLNYARGLSINENQALGHIPPLFGRSSLSYTRTKYWFKSSIVYSGWKYADDFSAYGEDNDAEAMEKGFPSWWTANLSGGFMLGKHLEFDLAIENIFDRFYKPWASGLAAPGRNFIVTLRFLH